jgi:Uma2 family endonuclease
MARSVSSTARVEERFTAERYFALVDEGVLSADDRVELLEGVIVAMAPQNPPHASTMASVAEALMRAVGKRAAVRSQAPLVVGALSVPEPDVAVVPGRQRDYANVHPTTALLVVEVAESSLIQDRLTKASIYAAAEIPEFWIINLRDNCVEIHRDPDARARRYRVSRIARRGERIRLVALPVSVAVRTLLPTRRK